MNKYNARKIAETITNKQLCYMLDAAMVGIIDWTEVSSVNKGMSKGTAWNILAKDFDVEGVYHIIGKTNMIREFGEFLPDELKIKNKTKANISINVLHQEPIFKHK